MEAEPGELRTHRDDVLDQQFGVGRLDAELRSTGRTWRPDCGTPAAPAARCRPAGPRISVPRKRIVDDERADARRVCVRRCPTGFLIGLVWMQRSIGRPSALQKGRSRRWWRRRTRRRRSRSSTAPPGAATPSPRSAGGIRPGAPSAAGSGAATKCGCSTSSGVPCRSASAGQPSGVRPQLLTQLRPSGRIHRSPPQRSARRRTSRALNRS